MEIVRRASTQAKANAIEEEEITTWRENFLRVALGSDASSFISQVMQNQSVTWDKTMDRMRKDQHAFESQQEQERKALEAQFRIAKWKLLNQCKKQAEESAQSAHIHLEESTLAKHERAPFT